MPPAAFRRAPLVGGLVTLLVLHLALAVWGLRHTGLTSDETAHLTAGYAYWKFNDYRLQPENGNLPQRWAGLALLTLQPVFPVEGFEHVWRASDVWVAGELFLFLSGNPVDELLVLARCFMLIWPVALTGLVFFWSRRLWGDAGALLSAALCAVSPTVLANGPLVNSDTTAAVCLLAATYTWWRCLQRPGGRVAALSVAATALAFIAKFSCVLLIPTFLLLAGLRWLHHRNELGRIMRLALAHGAGIWITIWLAFGLRFSPEGPGMPPVDKYFLPWDHMLSLGGPLDAIIQTARDWRLLPEAFINGFAHVRYQGHARDAFLMGDFRQTGWWWFFPATFMLKSTTAELVATFATLGIAVHKLIQHRGHILSRNSVAWPLLAFAIVYGIFSLSSTLNIGHRHILPLYPVLFIAVGGLMPVARHMKWWWSPALLPALSLVGALGIAPHFLAFFNAPSGGPGRAWTKLVDSSLDWGQGLPALAEWLQENRRGTERIYVSYFGTDSPRHRIPDATLLAPFYDNYRPRSWAPLEAGLYCIGATALQDVYSPFRGDWTPRKETAYRHLRRTLLPLIERGEHPSTIIDFGYGETKPVWELDRLRFNRLTTYLKRRRPEATVDHCMFVHRLSAEEVRIVTTGTPAELADLIEQAQARRAAP